MSAKVLLPRKAKMFTTRQQEGVTMTQNMGRHPSSAGSAYQGPISSRTGPFSLMEEARRYISML